MPIQTVTVYHTVTDEQGNPIPKVPVKIRLVRQRFIRSHQAEIMGWGVMTETDKSGYWSISLIPNSLTDDPESYYIVEEGWEGSHIYHVHYIRVPQDASRVWLGDIVIHDISGEPSYYPILESVVRSIRAEGNSLLKGDVILKAGTNVTLVQDNTEKSITINAAGGSGGPHNLLDGSVHPDTQATTVQRGMLIVGRVIAGIVKWAGLALGLAGKFLKSDGTDVVWGDVNWDEVQNKPSTFPPSPHTHVKADITDFAHTHPLSELQQSGATTGQVPKWSGTQWQAGNVDWNEVTNKPSTFPPAPHNHPRSDIVDFFSTPFWNNIPDKPSTFPPDPHTHDASDIVSGRLNASRLPTSPTANRFLVVRNANSDPTYDTIQPSDLPSHTHTKSDITDFAHTHPPSDITPQGHGSGLDADTVDGVHAENLRIATIGLTVGDGVNAITTGFKGAIYVPFSGQITEWAILSTDANPPTTGSIEIDILKSTFADYPTMASMVGTGTKPNIANSNKGQGSPTGWTTTAINAGDCIGFNVTSVSSLKRITIVLKVVKS